MWSLLDLIRDEPRLEVHVAYLTSEPATPFSWRNVHFYPLRLRRNRITGAESRSYMAHAVEAVRLTKPHLIHVHGTERAFGALPLSELSNARVVVSLQGLLSVFANCFLQGVLGKEIHKATSLPERLLGRGLVANHAALAQRAKTELQIIHRHSTFLGRTAWDRACVSLLNPDADYIHVDEPLRNAFYEAEPWRLGKHPIRRLVCSNVVSPPKGGPTLLRAVDLLRAQGHALQLTVIGGLRKHNGYCRYLLALTKELGLSSAVAFAGHVFRGLDIAKHLSEGDLFVSAS